MTKEKTKNYLIYLFSTNFYLTNNISHLCIVFLTILFLMIFFVKFLVSLPKLKLRKTKEIIIK